MKATISSTSLATGLLGVNRLGMARVSRKCMPSSRVPKAAGIIQSPGPLERGFGSNAPKSETKARRR
eukprot:scaffold275301_cov28-Tisochrysis_lutea.AAC.3